LFRQHCSYFTFADIIIGAGSAGCVIANRLSENPSVTVALIEAGSYAVPLKAKIPGLLCDIQLSSIDWQYKTIPQEYTLSRVYPWPRGKIVGGSSGINAMLYVRGHPSDYDVWESKFGCTGWNYKNVTRYFIRSERCLLKNYEAQFHGKEGYLCVSDTTGGQPSNLSKRFLEACDEIGIKKNHDYNGSSQYGASYSQVRPLEMVSCSLI
jgi:choline dehydrogenase